MNPELVDIPRRILSLAKGALSQANTHAVFFDPGNEHWDYISVINTAHAGELFLKAIIAKEHPLLIFKDIFSLDDRAAQTLQLSSLISRGRTHDFERLPQIVWAATGVRVPNLACFERLRKARNAVQHFCAPEETDFSGLSLEFIYTVIDPLIASQFGLYAIEFHEDHSIGYDYVVGCLLRRGLKFTVPDDFDIGEVDVNEEIAGAPESYKRWFRKELTRVGKSHLLANKRATKS
jgi:hypothetical protein